MRATYILFSYFIMVHSWALSQPERMIVHTDKTFYITGQTVWYKIYNTNYNQLNTHSEVAYLNIHDNSGKLIVQLKHQLIDGQANGSFSIPHQWKESYYYITCFTQWNLQFDTDQCYLKKIPVYNSLESRSLEAKADTTTYHLATTGTHRMSMEKTDYHRREEVQVMINPTDMSGCSVSVMPLEEYKAGIQFQNQHLYGNSIVYSVEFPCEKENSLLFRARLKDRSLQKPIDSDVLLLYKTNSNSFVRVSSKGGEINSLLGWFEGRTEYQLINMNPFQEIIPVISIYIPGKEMIMTDKDDYLPPRTQLIENCIRNEKIRVKADELFNENKVESFPQVAFNPISFKSDRVYLMEKFKGMKSLEEFFREIVIAADMNSKNGQTTIRLKNSETRLFFMEKPWYLVDGKLTRNEAEVLALPFKSILRVEIFNTTKSILNQLDPLMVRSGLIVVYTDGQIPLNTTGVDHDLFFVDGLSGHSEFVIKPENKLLDDHENPQFRSPVYWNPEIKSGFSFPVTDDSGDFIILAEGLLKSGEYWRESATYRVGN